MTTHKTAPASPSPQAEINPGATSRGRIRQDKFATLHLPCWTPEKQAQKA